MDDHADVDKGRSEQVGYRNRVEGNRDAFPHAIGAHELFAEFAPRGQNPLPNLIAEVSSEQARVERGECLALRIEDLP